MYRVFRSKDFEKSYERIKRSGKLKPQVVKSLTEAIDLLRNDQKLPLKYRDHQLRGEIAPYRECHLKGDLLLVYELRKNELILILADIGTHSYLDL